MRLSFMAMMKLLTCDMPLALASSTSSSAISRAMRRLATRFSSGAKPRAVWGKSGRTTAAVMPSKTANPPSMMYSHCQPVKPRFPASPWRIPAAMRLPTAPARRTPE